MGDLRIGTASWTDKTLLESGWYPKEADTPQARLEYYAENFQVVEVDSTYYSLPSERNSALWADRTPKGFQFDVKAFSLLTQHPTKLSAIPKALRPEDAKARVYAKDLPAKTVDEVWERFLGALAPLHDAGKLGALLFQFPQWFPGGKNNRQYILECAERCKPYRMSVEFRNHTWMDPEYQEKTLDFLRGYGLSYVCVDMPQGFTSSIPPVVAATADLAVVRFHGHSKGWNSNNIYERFGYQYSEKELEEWAPKLRELAREAKETHVLMNNCYRNYAQVNAAQLAALI
ncbi:MAG: hypothetical protein JWN96_1966 [Mycobacterium sp.]|jgi:uncharacterized protein YecE (DUF72 family)|nr:hypothetical protein [Mycobacterium sp.]